ncbi:phage portal protein [Kribbella sindirgiensis]|uniref:Phage portal protein n=2 Tax=Kribbella sindirgiensis TaxID=1124744 RepID=A0A4R0IBV8_9ACTN|nr:phage portal protein [Kribbella sindirgiensis]
MLVLHHDREHRLERIDRYRRGTHEDPYKPSNADREYKELWKRAITNVMPLLVNTPVQAMYVDDYRAGYSSGSSFNPAAPQARGFQMEHWQNSRLDARQGAIYRGALDFGHSFTVTEKLDSGKVITKGLSALRTSALFEDPANDETPYAAFTVTRWPRNADDPEKIEMGQGRLWDGDSEYKVEFKSLGDPKSASLTEVGRHGASECPVTRFAAAIDLDGRTVGVIEPMIPLQNRINQTIFDLLIAQTYGSFKVRTITGMAPPLKRDPETGEPIVDENGNPVPLPINISAKRVLFGEDSDVKFGTLDETPLEGYIEAIKLAFQHFSALGQVPPHHLLGQIANLSAEALLAAETSLARHVEMFRHAFGEAWERVFRLAGELSDNTDAAEDMAGEVIWRDMEQRSLAQAADALGKLKEQLGIPGRGLWPRVPGATAGEIAYWEQVASEEQPELELSQRLSSSSGQDFGPEPAPTFVGALP